MKKASASAFLLFGLACVHTSAIAADHYVDANVSTGNGMEIPGLTRTPVFSTSCKPILSMQVKSFMWLPERTSRAVINPILST